MSPGTPMCFDMRGHALSIVSDKNPLVRLHIRQHDRIVHAQSWCAGITYPQHIDLRIVPLQRAQKTWIKILIQQIPYLHGAYCAARSRRIAPTRCETEVRECSHACRDSAELSSRFAT